MKTVDMNMWHRLDKLDYDSIGIIQATNNITGEVSLELVKRKDFEKENPGCHVCPTFEMVAEWLRTKHNFIIYVSPYQRQQTGKVFYQGLADNISVFSEYGRLLPPLYYEADDYDQAFEGIIDVVLRELEKDLNNE